MTMTTTTSMTAVATRNFRSVEPNEVADAEREREPFVGRFAIESKRRFLPLDFGGSPSASAIENKYAMFLYKLCLRDRRRGAFRRNADLADVICKETFYKGNLWKVHEGVVGHSRLTTGPSGSSLQSSDCNIAVSTTPADWFDHWRLFDIRQPRSRNSLTLCNPRPVNVRPPPPIPPVPPGAEKSHLDHAFVSPRGSEKEPQGRRDNFVPDKIIALIVSDVSPCISLLCESHF